MKGKVLWFNDRKGYGFLVPDGAKAGARDIWVHYSAIAHLGHRTLLPEQRVEFEVIAGERGPMAHNVRLVQPERAEVQP